MIKNYTYFLYMFISLFLYANTINSQTISNHHKSNLPLNLNWKLIQTEYSNLLNKLREEQHLNSLLDDNVLTMASFDQAHYMDSTRKVTHDQKVKRKESPQKRVFYYNGTHDQIGENCIMIYINKPQHTKYTKELVNPKTEKDIANILFMGWKTSPGHYKNMITPGYDVAGLGYYFNKDSSALYCAQVFGAKPFVPKKGLDSPDNAYDIKETNSKECACMNTKAWTDLNAEISMTYYNDSVFLSCKKLDGFKSFFNNPNDGIYLDYVLRDQFPCEKNNLLHGSPIYDGFMTKPVLFKDMLKRNLAPGNNLFAAIGPIPKEVKNLQYGLNYGVIKNGYSCIYTFVTSIPNQNLDILHLIPKWIDNQDLTIKEDTFNGILKFNVPFQRGKSSIEEQQKKDILKRMDVYKPFIKSLRIKTFSSIEGSSDINLKLQKERAQQLKDIISTVTTTELNTDIESKENWEQFFNEIKGTRYAYLISYSKPKIKEVLQSKKMLDSLDIILKSTRIAQVEIDITASITKDSDPYILLGAYKKALQSGDSLRAFACQSRLIYFLRQYKLKNNDITSIEIPQNKKFIAHLTNWVGLATNDPELFYSYKTREMAVLYSNLDTNYLPLQFNYCIMALKYIHELGDTIIPMSQLEYKMKKCYQLKTKKDSTYVDYMFLNYNILTAFNNYTIHRFEKIEKPLREIKAYFNKHEITETEAIKLGLLFNMYGYYNWTLEMLNPMLKKYPTNNDILFLFLKTYVPSNGSFLKENEYLNLLSLAKKRDKKRFTEWIDVECFQLMRHSEIKTEYCKP